MVLSVFDKLPSERETMRELGVCRSTVRQALLVLEAENRIVREHGRGYYKIRG